MSKAGTGMLEQGAQTPSPAPDLTPHIVNSDQYLYGIQNCDYAKGGQQMGAIRLGYVIEFVADMGEAVKFYRDVLGLQLKFESPGWSEFVTGATTRSRMPEAFVAVAVDVHKRHQPN